ncbi:hypothetical protein LSAT2_010848 [Lamellibrachia satsuma]|nr:hypothetical protein LSAT2_010848 [Lamellibrachia satsuma]
MDCPFTGPIGTQGVDCKGTQSCDDKPCDNGGTCIHTQGSIKCMCPNTFHGHFCHKPVGCGLVDCENGGSCIEDVSGKWVSCECAAGYMGDFCQNETIALANVTGENITLAEQETEWMAKKTQTASALPYLSTLLLLPMASGVAGCILYRRQKVKDQEDDEDDDEDEDEDDDDDESNEDASESQSPSSSADS